MTTTTNLIPLTPAQVLWLADSHGIEGNDNVLAFYNDLISTTPLQSNAERVPIDCRQCGHFNNLKSKCMSTVSCKGGDMFYDGGFVPLYAEAEITKGQQ